MGNGFGCDAECQTGNASDDLQPPTTLERDSQRWNIGTAMLGFREQICRADRLPTPVCRLVLTAFDDTLLGPLLTHLVHAANDLSPIGLPNKQDLLPPQKPWQISRAITKYLHLLESIDGLGQYRADLVFLYTATVIEPTLRHSTLLVVDPAVPHTDPGSTASCGGVVNEAASAREEATLTRLTSFLSNEEVSPGSGHRHSVRLPAIFHLGTPPTGSSSESAVCLKGSRCVSGNRSSSAPLSTLASPSAGWLFGPPGGSPACHAVSCPILVELTAWHGSGRCSAAAGPKVDRVAEWVDETASGLPQQRSPDTTWTASRATQRTGVSPPAAVPQTPPSPRPSVGGEPGSLISFKLVDPPTPQVRKRDTAFP